jgi:anti-sigma factor RsiW
VSRCDVSALSALVDGDLSPRRARRLRAHVEGCHECARALGDLESMKRGLGALSEPAGEDRWSAVVNRLAQAAPHEWREPVWARSWRYLLPTLAALVLASAGGAWLRWHKGRGLSADAVIAQAESEFHKADEHYRRALEKLRPAAESERHDWALLKRAEYDAAQAQLEAAVTRCHEIAEERPADVDAEELLFAAYRKEIRFFEDQMMREGR